MSETPTAPRALELELFGHCLTVVSDSDPELVRDVVEFVNRRMESIQQNAKRVGTDQIALLAALNIAEELFEERKKGAAVQKTVRERSRFLLGRIDEVTRQVDALGPEQTP